MPAVTYLSDSEVKAGRAVKDDKDCNDLLQEFRQATGEDWIIEVRTYQKARTAWQAIRRKLYTEMKVYTLYADCHGEWQVMNLVTPKGGSIFYLSDQSREDAMNYMLGYLGGLHHAGRATKAA